MKSLMDAGQRLTAQDTMVLMEDTYRAFVLDNTPRFKQLFAHLLDNGEPLVFHCTAGKDRTGFAAALILQALGVSRALVMQDYLLSNDYFRLPLAVQNEPSALPQEALAVLWRVQQSFWRRRSKRSRPTTAMCRATSCKGWESTPRPGAGWLSFISIPRASPARQP